MTITQADSKQAASACSSGNAGKSACVECTAPDEIDAFIVFPTLGAPQILPDGATECTVIVVTDGYGYNQLLDNCKGAVLVNQHLRLIDLEADKKTLLPPCDSKLYENITKDHYDPSKKCNKEEGESLRKNFIEINHLRKASDNTLYCPEMDKDCKPVMTGLVFKDPVENIIGRLSPEAVSLYAANGFIDYFAITLKNMNVKPGPKAKSWAWIVTTSEKSMKNHVFLKLDPKTGKVVTVEGGERPSLHQPLDRLIHNKFIELSIRQPSEGGLLKEPSLYEILIADEKNPDYTPPQTGKANRRVQAWHPVMTKPEKPLELGHLTDTHISVRAATIAKSPARVIEDNKAEAAGRPFQPVGKRVAHTYKSFKVLIDATKNKGADALAVTGDAIDFNRNVDPQLTENYKTVQEVWSILNCVVNARKMDGAYKRGLDHLYFFSLMMYALREKNLPTYYVTGNHEGYQWPYGISPRVNDATASAVAGNFTGWGSNYSGRLNYFTDGEMKAWERVSQAETDLNKAKGNLAKAKSNLKPNQKEIDECQDKVNKAQSWYDHTRKEFDSEEAKTARFGKRKVEAASEYHQKKATECMPSDHNLTIYEACLAFGPTYGQVILSQNFRRQQFDWIHWLYTPFSDLNVYPCCKSLVGKGAKQVFTLLGWGGSERMLAGLPWIATGNEKGEDRRGRGFLPYAPESICSQQHKVIEAASEAAKASAGKWTVLSHFTVANFHDSVPASVEPMNAGFQPSDKDNEYFGYTIGDTNAQYNFYNWGGCEKGLKSYIDKYTSKSGAPQSGKVHLHISGHSHRSGVYTLGDVYNGLIRRSGVEITCSVPKLEKVTRPLPSVAVGTRYIVGTTAGPMGKMALSGWSPSAGRWENNKPTEKGGSKYNAMLGGWLTRPPSGLIVNTGTGDLEYVIASKDDTRNDIPRLAVMLDYRELMSLPEGEEGQPNRPIVFNIKENGNGKAVKFDDGIYAVLSEEAKALGCLKLNEIKVWVYKVGPPQEKPASSGEGAPASSPSSSSGKGEWQFCTASVSNNMLKPDDVGVLFRSALTTAVDDKGKPDPKGGKVVLCAFMEIPLQKPTDGKDAPWDEVKHDESWVFPVDIGVDTQGNEYLNRGMLATGEVPKWEFLKEHCGYPNPENIIRQKPNSSTTKKS